MNILLEVRAMDYEKKLFAFWSPMAGDVHP